MDPKKFLDQLTELVPITQPEPESRFRGRPYYNPNIEVVEIPLRDCEYCERKNITGRVMLRLSRQRRDTIWEYYCGPCHRFITDLVLKKRNQTDK